MRRYKVGHLCLSMSFTVSWRSRKHTWRDEHVLCEKSRFIYYISCLFRNQDSCQDGTTLEPDTTKHHYTKSDKVDRSRFLLVLSFYNFFIDIFYVCQLPLAGWPLSLLTATKPPILSSWVVGFSICSTFFLKRNVKYFLLNFIWLNLFYRLNEIE